MRLAGPAKWLRIYIGERDHWHGKPLYLAIVELFRREGLAGATVYRGLAGYGASGHLHTTRIVQLSIDLPIVIEAIDTPEKIAEVLPKIDEMVSEGLIILADCEVVAYRTRRATPDRTGSQPG